MRRDHVSNFHFCHILLFCYTLICFDTGSGSLLNCGSVPQLLSLGSDLARREAGIDVDDRLAVGVANSFARPDERTQRRGGMNDEAGHGEYIDMEREKTHSRLKRVGSPVYNDVHPFNKADSRYNQRSKFVEQLSVIILIMIVEIN